MLSFLSNNIHFILGSEKGRIPQAPPPKSATFTLSLFFFLGGGGACLNLGKICTCISLLRYNIKHEPI